MGKRGSETDLNKDNFEDVFENQEEVLKILFV